MNNPSIARMGTPVVTRTAGAPTAEGAVRPTGLATQDGSANVCRTANSSGRESVARSIAGFTLCHFSTGHAELKSRSFHRQCIPLAASGVRVRYVSPAPFQGTSRGIDFVRVPKRTSRLRRVFAGVALVKSLLAQRADVYHFQDTELFPAALALKLACRKRVVYDAYEDFPSMARGSARVPRILKPLAEKAVAGLEQLASHFFDGVMTADPITMRRIARAGDCQKLVFYNFPNLDFFPTPPPGPKIFDLVYRGGIADRAGTAILLDAMHLLSMNGRRMRLLLLGYFDNSAAEAALRERISRMGLAPSVELQGRLDHEKMAQTLSLARVGVSPLQDIPKFRINIPVKIFEYWACGLPVIASDLPPMRPFVRNLDAGLLFPPGDAGALSMCIGWMLDHPLEANQMGRRGRKAIVERFNNESESRKFREFCIRIAKPRGQSTPGDSV
jgi:glycosyltransferase involved in cell wall biosynthesis